MKNAIKNVWRNSMNIKLSDADKTKELFDDVKRKNYYEWQEAREQDSECESYEEWKKRNKLGVKYISDEIIAPQIIKHLDGKRIATVGGLKLITDFSKLAKDINAIYIREFIPEETDIIVSSNIYFDDFIKNKSDWWENIKINFPDLSIIRESEFLKLLGFKVPKSECKGEAKVNELENYTVIDLEATGFNTNECEIIELAAVTIRNNEVFDTFSTLVKPNNEIPYIVTQKTNITNEMVEDAPTINDVFEKYLEFIGNGIILGHNIDTFDLPILHRYCKKLNLEPLNNDSLDTLKFARKCDIDVPNYKLTTLTKHFNIEHKDSHRALNDCIANFKCYEILKPKYTGNSKTTSKSSQSKTTNNKLSSCSLHKEYSNISEKNIVLTGDFKVGKRNEIKSFLEDNGASVKNSVSGKTNYVIIGSLGSEDWKFGNYGEKVEKALELQSKGKDIKIIKEEEFFKCLKETV